MLNLDSKNLVVSGYALDFFDNFRDISEKQSIHSMYKENVNANLIKRIEKLKVALAVKAQIFARTRPEQKASVIKFLK